MKRLFSSCSAAVLVFACALSAPIWAQPGGESGISLSVDLRSGATVSDMYLVTAIATSPRGIAKVEFMVDGQLAGSDTSTPYTFDWDTIALDDGEHTLSVVACDLEGASTHEDIEAVVDNDLAAGVEAHLSRGRDFSAVGNSARAILQGRKALRIEPESADALRFLADVYYGDGKLATAAEYYEKVVAKEPSDTSLRRLLSRIYVKLSVKESPLEGYRSMMDKAISHAQAAEAVELSELEHNVQAGGSSIDEYRLGRALLERGDAKDARARFLHAQSGDLSNALYRNASAIASIFAGETREAEVGFDWLERRKLDDYLTACGRGLLALKAHRFTEAKEHIQKALASQPENPYVLMLSSLADVRDGNGKAAEEVIDSAIAQAPDSALAHYYKAGIEADARKFEDALTEVNKAIELDPTYADAHALKGFLFMLREWTQQVDPFAAGKVSIDIALSLDAKSPYALCAAAIWADEVGKETELLDYATRASEADPAEPYVQMVLARAYQESRDLDKMREAMKKAFEADKKNFALAKPPSSWDMVQMINRFGRRPSTALPAK
jgi:tetratricopeptide (TPR) repeat protein